VAEELVRYQLSDGGSVLVEVRAGASGYEHCSRVADGVIEAGRTLESAFAQIVPSTRAVLHSVAELHASEVNVEFGIKLAGEVGMVIARSAAEGHFSVRITFQQEEA
jgi:hypothetical protein